MDDRTLRPEEHFIETEPYYEPVADEVAVFAAAYRNRLPLLLKGPTGYSKPRFMEYMAWRLQRPLITSIVQDLGELPDAGPEEGVSQEEGTYHYPEWDFGRRHYRKN